VQATFGNNDGYSLLGTLHALLLQHQIYETKLDRENSSREEPMSSFSFWLSQKVLGGEGALDWGISFPMGCTENCLV